MYSIEKNFEKYFSLSFQKILKLACCKKIWPPMNLLDKTN